jgi:hypothetical protein
MGVFGEKFEESVDQVLQFAQECPAVLCQMIA